VPRRSGKINIVVSAADSTALAAVRAVTLHVKPLVD
jgi:hypothetical protein